MAKFAKRKFPASERSIKEEARQAEILADKFADRPYGQEKTPEVKPEPPAASEMIRTTFYQDAEQKQLLERVCMLRKLKGIPSANVSEMIRDAIENYIIQNDIKKEIENLS